MDLDCGLNDPTDFHSADGLEPLTQNGSRPIGGPFNAPAFPGVVPLTNAFVDDTGPAHDTVPPAQCEIDGKAVTVDARGAPRRDDGCDAGAIERTLCGPAVVYNVGSLIGTGEERTAPASRIRDAEHRRGFKGGDDQFFTVRPAGLCLRQTRETTSIYPGTGDDRALWRPGEGPGRLRHHPTDVEVDLAAGTATGSGGGPDLLRESRTWMGATTDDALLGDVGQELPARRRGRGRTRLKDAVASTSWMRRTVRQM